MPKFFFDKNAKRGNDVTLTGDDASHISRVLRMREGDKVTLCDGCGMDYDGVIKTVGKDVTVALGEGRISSAEPKTEITLFQGVPKAAKMEYIAQKCAEIGVCRIVPVNTVRSLGEMDKPNKSERVRKIAEEAAKQSGRGIIPVIENPVTFSDATDRIADFDLALIPYEEERERGLKSVLDGISAKKVAIFIGPEGGFEKSEVEEAIGRGAISVTLGPRILRTETAGLAVAAIVLCAFGDMM